MAFDVSILPTILGMGAKIGGAIPGLKKPKRTNAGGRAAARTASQANAAAVGAAQAGHGASRGLALREGLRSATGQVAAASGAAADAAAQDEASFQKQLDERNANLAGFGNDMAAGLSTMTQALISPESKALAKTGAVGLTKNANSESAFEQAEQTLPGAVPDRVTMDDDPEAQAIQDEVATLMKNAQLAEDDDPRFSGPHADFATSERLEQLRAKSPTVAAPQIEAALENRLRSQKLMRQDAERMGMNLESIWPMISRQLQLQPGQGLANPMGISFQTDFDSSVDAPEGE